MNGATEQFALPRRLHPLTMFYRGIVRAPGFLLALYYSMQRGDTWVLLVASLFYVFVALPSIILGYFYFQFRISPREVIIERGVFSRRTRNIPLDRIQNIETQQNFLQRLFGIARVYIETAGGAETEGVLEFVSVADAEAIRTTIREHQSSAAHQPSTRADAAAPEENKDQLPHEEAPAETADAAAETGPTATERLLYAMSPRRVLSYGMLRLSLWFIAVIFSALQYVNVAPDRLAEEFARSQVESLRAADTTILLLQGIGFIFLVLFLSWLSGILFAYNKYHGFRLSLANNNLHKQHGLFNISKGSIPLKKLQMMVITSNPLMRRFDFRGLQIQTAGFAGAKRGAEVAVPLAKSDETVVLAQEIRPFVFPDDFTMVSPLTIRRAFLRYSIFLLLLGAALYTVLPATVWLLMLLPLLYYAALLRYRHRGYKVEGDTLIVKHGFIWQRISVIPIAKIQTLSVLASFFQRRLGLATLYVDTAGAAGFNDASIIDIDAESAGRILDELMAAFKAAYPQRPGAADKAGEPERPADSVDPAQSAGSHPNAEGREQQTSGDEGSQDGPAQQSAAAHPPPSGDDEDRARPAEDT